MFRRLLISALAAAALQATTLERLSVDDMSAKSTAIVRGRVLGGAGEFRNGVIYTRYQLLVQETWKGAIATDRQIDVYVPGGLANGMRQSVPGSPVLEPGEEYLVFLWAGASGRQQIIGLSQGVFSLVREESGAMQVERPGAREMMIDPATGRAVLDASIRMPLGEMKTRVVTKLMEMQAAAQAEQAK